MRTKEDIIQIAKKLFGEQGYQRTGMRDIACALSIRESTLYGHVASKEELLWDIMQIAMDGFLLQAAAIPEGLPLEMHLIAWIRGHLNVMVNEPYAVAVLFQEWGFLQGERRRYL